MSRHNRRRTRGSHKNYTLPVSLSSFTAATPLLSTQALPAQPGLTVASFRHGPGWAGGRLGGGNGGGGSSIAARHWHNRYLAWQTRERRQREELAVLEAEKRRIFGETGEDGEGDDGLCEKMLEYFGELDFIEG